MVVYAYTLTLSGQHSLKGLGKLNDIDDLLKRMKLLGDYPFTEVVNNPSIIDRESGARVYIHAEGEKDEWRLRWMPFV